MQDLWGLMLNFSIFGVLTCLILMLFRSRVKMKKKKKKGQNLHLPKWGKDLY